MPQSLAELEQQRAALLHQISQLGAFRAGSITGTGGRCGNRNCHCHRPKDPGHSPHPRLTYKRNRKTVTESFSSAAAQRKAEREVEAFREWQRLSRAFVEINEQLCRARSVEESLTPQEKNGAGGPPGSGPRSRPDSAYRFPGVAQDGTSGPGVHGNGGAFGHA